VRSRHVAWADVAVTIVGASAAPRAAGMPSSPGWRTRRPGRRRTAATAPLAKDVLIEAHGSRFTAVIPGTPAANVRRHGTAARPDAAAWPTRTRTRSTARCAAPAARGRRAVTRSGPGASACTRSPEGSTRTATSRSPAPSTPRWRWPGHLRREFHYLHHAAGGKRYRDPNEFGRRLIRPLRRGRADHPARCLLPGRRLRPGGRQVRGRSAARFGDGSAAGWAERSPASAVTRSAWRPRTPGSRRHPLGARGRPGPGAGDHGVVARARRPGARAPVGAAAGDAESRAAFGGTPAEVLYDAGALGPRTTLVHATHLTGRDVDLLGGSLPRCACARSPRPTSPTASAPPRRSPRGLTARARQRRAQRHRPLRRGPLMELGQRLVTRRRGHSAPPTWPRRRRRPGMPASAGPKRARSARRVR